MRKNIHTRETLSNKNNFVALLPIWLLICTAISGCAVNKVSLMTCQSTNSPIKASEVQFYQSVDDITGPWQLQGIISAYVLPVVNNTTERRVALVKESVAALGINSIVAPQPNIGDGVGRTGHFNGLLVQTGIVQKENIAVIPKFIVCIPQVDNRLHFGNLPYMNNLNNILREYIQYLLSYQKGYFVYWCDSAGVNNATILQGSAKSEDLKKPIGIAPDYAILCDIDPVDYSEEFIKLHAEDIRSGKLSIKHSLQLKISIALFDIKKRETVWTNKKLIMSPVGSLSAVIGDGFDAVLSYNYEPYSLSLIKNKIIEAMDTVPVVPGFRADKISIVNGN